MRGLWSTGAMLLVLVGLGAYIYFVTWKQPDPALSTEDRVYTPLAAADIVEFTIKAESGDVTTVKKVGEDAWQIVAPVTFPASTTQVNGLTSILSYLDIVRVIDEDPKDLNEYGLANPRLTIDFKLAGDKSYGSLLLGNKNPTGASLYAKRSDEKRVVLIGQHQEASLDRTTFDLREKKIVTFTREQVSALEISRGRERLAFKKDGNRWMMASPVSARADVTEIDKVIESIDVAQMKSVVKDEATPEDLRSYGLDRPEVSVVVDVGTARMTLQLGAQAGEDVFYAKDASKPLVMTVEKLLADELKKPADTFRRKEVFEFVVPTATRVEFTRNGQTVVFERVKGQGDNPQDSWRRVSPNPGDVDKAKLEALLTEFANLRATAFTPTTANTGLRTPVMTVVAKFDEGTQEEQITFGRIRTDAFASRPDEPGALKIEADTLEKAIATLDELSK